MNTCLDCIIPQQSCMQSCTATQCGTRLPALHLLAALEVCTACFAFGWPDAYIAAAAMEPIWRPIWCPQAVAAWAWQPLHLLDCSPWQEEEQILQATQVYLWLGTIMSLYICRIVIETQNSITKSNFVTLSYQSLELKSTSHQTQFVSRSEDWGKMQGYELAVDRCPGPTTSLTLLLDCSGQDSIDQKPQRPCPALFPATLMHSTHRYAS